MNKVILMGNLTKDPEFSTLSNGVNVTKFTVAVQRKFKNANNEYETDFINCVAWRTTAEFIHKYFKKGGRIAISGSIQNRSYDTTDGTKRYITEVIVDECEIVQVLSKKNNDSDITEEVKDELKQIEIDDLPF